MVDDVLPLALRHVPTTRTPPVEARGFRDAGIRPPGKHLYRRRRRGCCCC